MFRNPIVEAAAKNWSPTGILFSKKGTGHLFQLLGYNAATPAQMLEMSLQPIVEPLIQEKGCGFHSDF